MVKSDSSYYGYIKDIPVLSADQEKKLFLDMKSSDSNVSKRARKKLIESNLRLVYDIASKHYNDFFSFDDLFSAGCEGLIKAVDKFDVDKGLKFSTYGTRYIEGYIYRFIYKLKYGHLSYGIIGVISRMNSVYGYLTCKLNREPSDSEMANALSVSVEKYRIAVSAIKGNISLSYGTSHLSGEECDFFEDDNLFNDVFNLYDSVVDEVEQRLFYYDCCKIFDKLGFSDERIEAFKLKYGFDGNGEKSYKDIALIEGVSFQAIEQRISSGLNKIRKDKKTMKYFKSYNYEK